MDPAASGTEPRSHERLPREARIRRGVEIVDLLRRGRRRRTPHLEVFSSVDPGANLPRYGTIVPKHRHTVVRRNLLRRRLREIGRTRVLPRLRAAGLSVDVLVRASASAYSAPFSDLQSELVRITEELCSDASSSD